MLTIYPKYDKFSLNRIDDSKYEEHLLVYSLKLDALLN